jgi:hypothetical protein
VKEAVERNPLANYKVKWIIICWIIKLN